MLNWFIFNNYFILFYVFLMFILSSVFTYNKVLKESSWFLVIMIGTSLLGSYMWVVASRRLNELSDQLWFSLVWDILMMVAYYLIPLFFLEHKMNWQSWAALGLIVIGILWFKSQTSLV